MNVVDLLTHLGLYTWDMDNWDRKPDTNKMDLLLRPFIQDAYQRHLTSGVMTTSQGGYASFNRSASLMTNNVVSKDGTANTIVGIINYHMANLSTNISAQTAASNKDNFPLINASLQQFAANKAKQNQQHLQMMQRFVMLSANTIAATAWKSVPLLTQIYAPPAAQIFSPQPWVPNILPEVVVKTVVKAIAGADKAAVDLELPCHPWEQTKWRPTSTHRPQFLILISRTATNRLCNINSNPGVPMSQRLGPIRTSASLAVLTWKMVKLVLHATERSCSNYMEYKRPNHQYCCKAMHKTMYAQMWRLGVTINLKINSVKCVNDYYLSYPTKFELVTSLPHELDDDSITIVNLNTSQKKTLVMHQALGLMIEPNLVVANTRATSYFLTKGAPCQNKRCTLNPISITLPNRRKIMSTHVCDINIPGLPTTLTGHIVPNMTTTLFFWNSYLMQGGLPDFIWCQHMQSYLQWQRYFYRLQRSG